MTKKKGTFSKVSQVKKMSRLAVGLVPVTKVVPHKNQVNKETIKHLKRAIEKEVEDEA